MEPPAPPTPLRELVAQVIERFEEEGLNALEQVCAAHPELAASLRQRIETLDRHGLLHAKSRTPRAIPNQLGDFDLLDRLGAGGMGVVYLARQRSLQRLVALKLIRPELLLFDGPGSTRARFDREVAAIAKLRHPGIVPIYFVGEEGDLPYFAMEWIEGASLSALLEKLPARDPRRLDGSAWAPALTAAMARPSEAVAREAAAPVRLDELATLSWIDGCARLLLAAAESVAHAHSRGVLHRDLKPSNLMLAADGRLLLVDFGLASTSGTSRITRDGSELGSLPYLSPEQISHGMEAVGEASDVYALGVTFYELLTLRKAFFERDAGLTRARILAGEFAPPRALHPGLPTDVETVCLTAMERDRERRYRSAEAFAADLRHLLARQPIAARPPGIALRSRRFAQRHPAATVGALLGACIALGAPSLWGFLEHRRSRDLAEAGARLTTELAATKAANARAQRAAQNARTAVTEFLGRVGADLLKQVPRSEQVRRDLLERASSIYEGLLADSPDELPLRLEVAQHFRLLAMRCQEQGDLEASERAYGRAEALLDEVQATSSDDADWQRTLAMVVGDRGSSRMSAARIDAEVERDLARAADLLESLARRFPRRDPQLDANAVTMLLLSGDLQSLNDRFVEALVAYDRALALAHELGVDTRRDDASRKPVYSLRSHRAAALRNLGRIGDAIVEYEALAATLAEELSAAPRHRELRQFRGEALTNLGSLLVDEARQEDAIDVLREAAELFDGLAADFPATPVLRYALLIALDSLAMAEQEVDDERWGTTVMRGQKLADDLAQAGYRGPSFLELRIDAALRTAIRLDRADERAAATRALQGALEVALTEPEETGLQRRRAAALNVFAALAERATESAQERLAVKQAAAQLRAEFPDDEAVLNATEKERA